MKNKFLSRILELTEANKIKWQHNNSNIFKYSKRIIGSNGDMRFIIRISIKKTYVCFGSKHNDYREIKADRKDILQLYRKVLKEAV